MTAYTGHTKYILGEFGIGFTRGGCASRLFLDAPRGSGPTSVSAVDQSQLRGTAGTALEIDFFENIFQRVEEARMLQALNGTASSTNKSGKKRNGKRP